MDVQALFDEYGCYHRDPVNLRLHQFGFPMMFCGLFGLVTKIDPHGVWISLGLMIAFDLLNIYAAPKLGVIGSVVLAVLFGVGLWLPGAVLVALLGLGLGLPLIGHIWFERRWPETPGQLARFELVGHLWLLAAFLGTEPKAE